MERIRPHIIKIWRRWMGPEVYWEDSFSGLHTWEVSDTWTAEMFYHLGIALPSDVTIEVPHEETEFCLLCHVISLVLRKL